MSDWRKETVRAPAEPVLPEWEMSDAAREEEYVEFLKELFAANPRTPQDRRRLLRVIKGGKC